MSADESEQDLWWGEPADARRWHVFDGEGDCKSLCGNWMFSRRNEQTIDPSDEEFREGEDCKECARKAGVIDA